MDNENLSFRNCTAQELYELFGGQNVFYPPSNEDFILDGPYPGEDGSDCYDVVGRHSWAQNRNGQDVPRILLSFHYLDTDKYLYSEWDRRMSRYDKQYFIAQDEDGQVVAVVCHAFGGIESKEMLSITHRVGGNPTNFRYMNYVTLREGCPTEYATATLKALMTHLGDGSILASQWISKTEHPLVTPLTQDNDINFVMPREEESKVFPGEMYRARWVGDDWKRIDMTRPNFWAVDYQYDPQTPKNL